MLSRRGVSRKEVLFFNPEPFICLRITTKHHIIIIMIIIITIIIITVGIWLNRFFACAGLKTTASNIHLLNKSGWGYSWK